MNEEDFKQLKRIINLMPGMPLITFREPDGGWYMDAHSVHWTHQGEGYSEQIYESHNTVGDYMIVNLRLSTGCTETNIFHMGNMKNPLDISE